jgi:RNA polymerase sigma-70 factor (ECF subfamily)
MSKLKPSERDVLVLRYVADLSHREIGVACGLDEATARKRISRALSRLRQILPSEEIES